MLKQLFATMNDTLDEVIQQYPTADDKGKQDLHKKLEVLKSMSDSFIEQWLHFEEKLSHVLQTVPGNSWNDIPENMPEAPPEMNAASETFRKGQGYFQLLMFENANKEFEKVIELQPDYLLARLYLAMGQMRIGNDVEAYRHFRFITSLSEHAQMKAISYNAMGCIQAKNANMEQAQQLFKLAYSADPSCVEPMINMGICLSQHSGMKQSGPGFIH
ncbi:hypothetical protein FE783_05480 [Paenibacillus mesophilus]|uniref:tetratricopeptide repeat protein n=1 Tax=Paenibacillus mesophilus TaxID=2582849 RepID=UPI00110EFA20|nr:hypothetical protein [Paenibacillus mesophilus]TMV51236.1 hypothetical protein FE783_05480 [Paenibacillus mesophilus]